MTNKKKVLGLMLILLLITITTLVVYANITTNLAYEYEEYSITDEITENLVTITGTLQITVRAEQSGSPIFSTVFSVYCTLYNERITELNTDVNGIATLILEIGEYYLINQSAPLGFNTERTRITVTITADSTTQAEITLQRNIDIPYNENNIQLPVTGQELPALPADKAGCYK